MEALELLPLFLRLFRCPDKALRRLLFRHIIAGALPRLSLLNESRLPWLAPWWQTLYVAAWVRRARP